MNQEVLEGLLALNNILEEETCSHLLGRCEPLLEETPFRPELFQKELLARVVCEVEVRELDVLGTGVKPKR